MTYIPRRLRKRQPPPAPRYVITSAGPITPLEAEMVKRCWHEAGRSGFPLVVDGTQFAVKELR